MSRIAKSSVNAAFEWAAAQITEAGGRDGITSRAEIRRKIAELTGAERDLVDFFYRFIVRRGGNPSERVTRTDIDAALATARTQLVAAFDTDNNGLSSDEVAAMPLLGRLAVKVARRRTRTGEELAANFEALAFSLVFEDYSTELHNERFLSFHVPVNLTELTAQTFRDALGLPTAELPDPDEIRLRYRASVAHGLCTWLATASAGELWQRPDIALALAQRYSMAYGDLDTARAITEIDCG